jgi:hypothetical protein
MRSTELHWERRSWNHHLVRRVVHLRRIFLEVWIFRNVGNEFQNSVTDHFSAAAAKREDGVAHQDHAGARLVLVAYLIDTRLLDQLTGSQRAITLVKCFNVGVIQFHDGFFFVSFLPPRKARWRTGATRPISGMRSMHVQVGALRFRQKVLGFIFKATQAAGEVGLIWIHGSAMNVCPNIKFETL